MGIFVTAETYILHTQQDQTQLIENKTLQVKFVCSFIKHTRRRPIHPINMQKCAAYELDSKPRGIYR